MVSRRAFLVGGLCGAGALAAGSTGVGLVEAEVVPGRVPLDRMLGRCAVTVPSVTGTPAPVLTSTFRSRRRGTDVGLALVGARRGLPVVVGLHGWGGSADGFVRGHDVARHLGDAIARGVPPFAIAAVDGGPTYWHPRADGDDPVRMITDELLPMLAARGLRTDRIGIMGYSMGGYGALLLAETLGQGRVAATVVASPAVFGSYAEARRTNARAFDGPDDFARHDVMAWLGALDPRTTWIGCGRSDPFARATRRVRRRLGDPPGGLFEGCHDGAFWRAHQPDQFAFLGRRLRA